ncbi:DNA-processing protein DprA [Marinomonas sp. 15G1-11]|uniref:DNA-processing protein DprA n=1 Tax=Marinomonas phaeophyticola TaxID=3004091 RepID=A0ABT4JVQ2_9GAMM|nr:DNA-processing protein DprA [Marinomonas sp. 15G1-11]MCZ2721863.1 DNA-processing protein DprA [Marinomonas sp. 15G1-11]
MAMQLSIDDSIDSLLEDDQSASRQRPLTKLDWLCLSLMKGAGPTRLDRLWNYLVALEAAGDYSATFCSELDSDLFVKLKWPKATASHAGQYCQHGLLSSETKAKLESTMEWLTEEFHYLLLKGEMDYPPKLSEIPVPPVLLYVKGNLNCLLNTCLGIVGARRCSRYGRQLGYQFAKQLSEVGITIVSGGATGIDSAAHEGANAAVKPNVAVMGTGLEKCYPKSNTRLFETILGTNGALVSEYPLMTVARPNLFPPRNRIISGLSEGILVVEATEKSGSLISASYALQHNREVFAIPGRINERNARGCHKLIQQGATLVMDLADILNELPAVAIQKLPDNTSSDAEQTKSETLFMQPVEAPVESLSKVAQSILICFERCDKDEVLEFSYLIDIIGCSVSDLMQALVELEMSACIEAHTTGYRQCYQYGGSR